ncbi:MAG: tyrosine--tRNA ligase [Leadbetterella sp.]
MDFIEELKWRGMLHQSMPGTEEQLTKEMTSAYIGFDPTAKSLHIGNLATIMLLVHLQRAGHKPYALVGGATGMVGDPSGKSAERQFLSEDTLRENQNGIRVQLERFLEFGDQANAAVMVNNYDWFKEFSFLGFLREVGKFLSVNYMMGKDSVKNRLTTGISYTEFTYQLLQGYDFYHLYKNHGVKLQMGGSDQWGNITTGTELIRRKENNNNEEAEYSAYALTTPLVTKSDGTKFGKSEGGNVWLDPSLTSPYEFYQFWINQSDEDCKKLIRVFTLLDQATILDLEEKHQAEPHLRIVQKAIAQDVTTRVHGLEKYELAVKTSEILYGKATLEALQSLSKNNFEEIFKGVPTTKILKTDYTTCGSILDLISIATNGEIYPSKTEAKKAILGNALSINKQKITDPASNLEKIVLLNDTYLLINKGKKNHIIEVI